MYKYGLRIREFGIGNQPKGHVNFQYTNKVKTGYWSYVWYKDKLPENEIIHYQMDFLEGE